MNKIIWVLLYTDFNDLLSSNRLFQGWFSNYPTKKELAHCLSVTFTGINEKKMAEKLQSLLDGKKVKIWNESYKLVEVKEGEGFFE